MTNAALFASSGLETGPMFGWIGLSWWLLVRLQTGARRLADGVLVGILGLGSMIRPEQTMVALVFLGAMWLVVSSVAERPTDPGSGRRPDRSSPSCTMSR